MAPPGIDEQPCLERRRCALGIWAWHFHREKQDECDRSVATKEFPNDRRFRIVRDRGAQPPQDSAIAVAKDDAADACVSRLLQLPSFALQALSNWIVAEGIGDREVGVIR